MCPRCRLWSINNVCMLCFKTMTSKDIKEYRKWRGEK